MATTVFDRTRPCASVIEHSLENSVRGSFWLADATAPSHPRLEVSLNADLVVVGGGYTGLWTALLAKQREPDARVVLLEARTIGWAASGRNGGFCEASLTHGEDNGRSRFAAEYDQLDKLGLKNLDEIERTVATLHLAADFERNGAIDVATESHQVEWLREIAELHGGHGSGGNAANTGGNAGADTAERFLDAAEIQSLVHSPTYQGALLRTHDSAIVHPAKLAFELARVCVEHGVEIFEHSPVTELVTRGAGPHGGVEVHTARTSVHAKRVALGTNVFPSLLKRNRLATVPVYDYALMTEPLSTEQLASIGWQGRQGIGDSANQFHYYRLSADNRILWGGYDAVYHYGRQIRASYEERPATFQKLASHFFTTFPQLEELRFTHRWAGAIDTCSRFCAFFGTARSGRIAYATGYTGLGVAATRFGAEVMLDLLNGEKTERTELEMVKTKPMPFPPEPLASIGIQATRWSLNRADHNQGRRNLILKTLDAVGLGFDS